MTCAAGALRANKNMTTDARTVIDQRQRFRLERHFFMDLAVRVGWVFMTYFAALYRNELKLIHPPFRGESRSGCRRAKRVCSVDERGRFSGPRKRVDAIC